MMAVAVVLNRKAHRRRSSEFIGDRKACRQGSSGIEKRVVGSRRRSKSALSGVVGGRKARRQGSSGVEKRVVGGLGGSKSASSGAVGSSRTLLDFCVLDFGSEQARKTFYP